MNSSAKTTVVSFLAAAALGALVFGGCTVTTGSGTVDDTDGGTNNNNTNDADSEDTDSGVPDTGDNGGVCETKQTNFFEPADCQTCLNTKCCSELTACFALPADEANAKAECNGFKTCLDDCTAQEDVDACNQECVELVAADGVANAYIAIADCAETNCAAECAE